MGTKKKKQRSTDGLDVRNHELVPKHERCSETEKKSVLAKFKVEIKDLPKISIHDPAIHHLEAAPGDLIKITRDSPTAGKTFFYRVVIEIK